MWLTSKGCQSHMGYTSVNSLGKRKKNQTNTAGRAKRREGASRIMQAAWVSSASGSAVSDVQHATFNLFFCLFTAGNCWLQQGKNGRCQVLYMPGMSREECCRSGRLGTSWTEEDVPNSTLFRWMIFNGGAPNCIPCKGGGALIFLRFLTIHSIWIKQDDEPITHPKVRKWSLWCALDASGYFCAQGHNPHLHHVTLSFCFRNLRQCWLRSWKEVQDEQKK